MIWQISADFGQNFSEIRPKKIFFPQKKNFFLSVQRVQKPCLNNFLGPNNVFLTPYSTFCLCTFCHFWCLKSGPKNETKTITHMSEALKNQKKKLNFQKNDRNSSEIRFCFQNGQNRPNQIISWKVRAQKPENMRILYPSLP